MLFWFSFLQQAYSWKTSSRCPSLFLFLFFLFPSIRTIRNSDHLYHCTHILFPRIESLLRSFFFFLYLSVSFINNFFSIILIKLEFLPPSSSKKTTIQYFIIRSLERELSIFSYQRTTTL